MRHVVPALLALSCAVAPLSAADAQGAHDQAAAQAKDAFAELDRLAGPDLARMDDNVQKQAAAEQAKAEQVAAQASKAQVAAAVSPAAQKQAASDPNFDPAKAGAKPNVLVTAVEQDPEEMVDQLVEKAGLARGLNEGKGNAFVAVATVPVLADPGSDGYGTSRTLAYNQAFMQARLDIVRFVMTTVSSGMSVDRVKNDQLPQGNEVTKADQIAAKIAALTEAEIDAALRNRGVDPASVTPELKRKTLDTTVRKVVATEAAGQVDGATAFAIAEGKRYGKQHMTVAVLWSPNLQRMATFLQTQKPADLPAPAKGRPLREQIPQTPAELATRFGVKPCVDENGERWLLAWGQDGVAKDADPDLVAEMAKTAERNAHNEAMSALKAFVYEQTSTAAVSEMAETLQVLVNAKGDKEKIKATVSNLNEQMRAGSANIPIAGANPIKTFRTTVDGGQVVGVVLAWSPKNMAQAAKMKQMLDGKPADKKPEAGGTGADRHSSTPDQGSW